MVLVVKMKKPNSAWHRPKIVENNRTRQPPRPFLIRYSILGDVRLAGEDVWPSFRFILAV